jgi:hypothetical protein
MVRHENKSQRLADSDRQGKHVLFFVAAGALCLAAAFLVVTLLFSACSAQVSSTIKADGGARVSVQAEIPAPLSAKFRKLAASGASSSTKAQEANGPFFDAAAIRKSLVAKPGVEIVELTQPDPDSIHLVISARNLETLASSSDLKGTGLIKVTHGSGWTECRFSLARGDAKGLSALMPGIDPYLLDAISPPALEEDPVTVAEYKTMLKSVLGEKAMPAMEAAAIRLSITAPSVVISSGGGVLTGSTLNASIPIIDALVLEKPLDIWMRWKN